MNTRTPPTAVMASPQALCATAGSDAFFSEDLTEQAHVARTVCGVCPLRRGCLAEGLTHGTEYGVTGGTAEAQRYLLVSDQAPCADWDAVLERVGAWTRVLSSPRERGMLVPMRRWYHRCGHLLIGADEELSTAADQLLARWADLALGTRLWLVLHGFTRHPAWQDYYDHAKALYQHGGMGRVLAADKDTYAWLQHQRALHSRGHLLQDHATRLRALPGVLTDPSRPRGSLSIDVDAVVAAICAGATTAAVEARWGQIVHVRLRQAGEPTVHQIHLRHAQTLAHGGATVDEICARFPVKRKDLMRVLAEAGAPVVHAAPHSLAARASPRRTRADQIADALKNGAVRTRVARQFKLSSPELTPFLELHGYPSVDQLLAGHPHSSTWERP